MPKTNAAGYRDVIGIPGLMGINSKQRLYLMPAGDHGYSCYGFDVLRRKTEGFAKWANRPDLLPPSRKGTVKAFKAYQAAAAAAFARFEQTGERCPIELTPQLIGLEGKRVEVTRPDGSRRRFNVGKSMGWTPCHLEIANARSRDGAPVTLMPGDRVAVVG